MSGARLILIAALMSFSVSACSAPKTLTLRVDGRDLLTSPAPTVCSGRIYVPITAFRKMGLFVNWKYGESSGTVAWPETDLIYDVTAGQPWVPGQIAGSRVELPGTPFMSGDQLMVSLRTPVIDTPSTRDFQIEWNSKNRIANIRRSKRWLKERMNNDAEMKAAWPGCYETPM